MATHSSILAWEISWTEEPGRLCTVHGVAKEPDTTEQLNNISHVLNTVPVNLTLPCYPGADMVLGSVPGAISLLSDQSKRLSFSQTI